MSFINWLASGAKSMWDANAKIPFTDRHFKNWVLQESTQVGEEIHTADIGNGKTVTVTIKDVIRASGCEKWEVNGVCSDGRTAKLVEEKSKQPDKMKVAEAVVRKLM
jgi:hypothetical protein